MIVLRILNQLLIKMECLVFVKMLIHTSLMENVRSALNFLNGTAPNVNVLQATLILEEYALQLVEKTKFGKTINVFVFNPQ